jgi:16S rRNA (cytosine1402-N4)-methyltransferase
MVKSMARNGNLKRLDPSKHSDPQVEHIPVMLQEVLETLSPQANAIYVDGTFGLGGYTRALLTQANCRVIAFDQDPAAASIAARFKREFGARFEFVGAPFEKLKETLQTLQVPKINGLVLDLGVSSPQLDRAERGFSFRFEGPLDMRMQQQGITAADVLNEESEEMLADIFWRYGEERQSRSIARKIVQKRCLKPFETTKELADLIAAILPFQHAQKIHPATRVFQALRIFVNRELEQLKNVLEQSIQVLQEMGRLVVVSFHSLEDRIVKEFFQTHQKDLQQGSRYLPRVQQAKRSFYFEVPRKKVVKPGEQEVRINPRARSARLRWGIYKTIH